MSVCLAEMMDHSCVFFFLTCSYLKKKVLSVSSSQLVRVGCGCWAITAGQKIKVMDFKVGEPEVLTYVVHRSTSHLCASVQRPA